MFWDLAWHFLWQVNLHSANKHIQTVMRMKLNGNCSQSCGRWMRQHKWVKMISIRSCLLLKDIQNKVSHTQRASNGFCSTNRLRVFLTPPHRWNGSPLQFYPRVGCRAGTHWYTQGQRGTMSVKCRTQEFNTMSPARGPFSKDPETLRARRAIFSSSVSKKPTMIKRNNHDATVP